MSGTDQTDRACLAESYKWSLDEYILRLELEDVQEILVEGAIDKIVLVGWLRGVGARCDVATAESVVVPEGAVLASGGHLGAKGRLIAIAEALREVDAKAPGTVTAVVIVDRDYDDDARRSDAFLVLTDGHSMESYAYSPGSLAETCRVFFSGQVVAHVLFSHVEAACREVAAARRVLRGLNPPVALVKTWSGDVRVSTAGAAVSGDVLVDKSVRGSREEKAEAIGRLEAERTIVDADPLRMVRGHDYFEILRKVLSHTTAPTRARQCLRGFEADDLARMVLGFLDVAVLCGHEMFRNLRAILESWASQKGGLTEVSA